MAKTPLSWKYYLRDYFTYPKGQRRALAFVLALLMPAILFPFVYNRRANKKKAEPIVLQQVAALTVASENESEETNRPWTDSGTKHKAAVYGTLFYFDPNTATETDWKRLGLRDRTVETILKYRSKGGKFYKPEDLKKIYGLKEAEANRLMPFVLIKQVEDHQKFVTDNVAKQFPKTNDKDVRQVDINAADSAQLIALPGIGTKLALRIIKYRDALGGFYNINQVAEVFGLPDSTFQKIKPQLVLKTTTLVKRNINTATVAELKTPYIPYNVANAIVQYRKAHGNFLQVTDLKAIPLIDEDLYVKIAPYLTIGQ